MLHHIVQFVVLITPQSAEPQGVGLAGGIMVMRPFCAVMIGLRCLGFSAIKIFSTTKCFILPYGSAISIGHTWVTEKKLTQKSFKQQQNSSGLGEMGWRAIIEKNYTFISQLHQQILVFKTPKLAFLYFIGQRPFWVKMIIT